MSEDEKEGKIIAERAYLFLVILTKGVVSFGTCM